MKIKRTKKQRDLDNRLFFILRQACLANPNGLADLTMFNTAILKNQLDCTPDELADSLGRLIQFGAIEPPVIDPLDENFSPN